MSSLAAQLAQSASLNAGLLVDRSRRKPTESYLFSGKDVDTYDLESIHALALNGFLQLSKLEPALKRFQASLFGEHAKGMDRTLLSQEQVQALDTKLEQFLQLLARWIMETPTGCIIEWLVKRFRINEFNIPTVLSVFLPYHESVHFAKMLSILHIKPQTTWSFLLPFKSAAQSLPRMPLVTEMLQNVDVARFVISLLPAAITTSQEGGPQPYSALLTFNAACVHDYLSRVTRIDEGTAAFLLPALLAPLSVTQKSSEAVLGSLVLLVFFSSKCTLSPAALNIIIRTISQASSTDEQTGAQCVTTTQCLKAVVSILGWQDELAIYDPETLHAMFKLRNILQTLKSLYAVQGVEKLLRPMLPNLIQRTTHSEEHDILEAIISSSDTPESVVERATTLLLEYVMSQSSDDSPATTTSRDLLVSVWQRHHPVFTRAFGDLRSRQSQEGPSVDALDQLRIFLSMAPKSRNLDKRPNSSEDELDTIVASTSVDAKVRAVAVGRLLEIVQSHQTTPEEKISANSALLARAQDANSTVIDALYAKAEVILPIFSADHSTYIGHLIEVLCNPNGKVRRPILRAHLQFLVAHFLPSQGVDQGVKDEVFHRLIFPFLLFSKPKQHTAEAAWAILASAESVPHEWIADCAKVVQKDGDQVHVEGVEKMIEINTEIAATVARNILKSKNYSHHLDVVISTLEDTSPSVRALGHLICRSLVSQLSGDAQVEVAMQLLKVISIRELPAIEDIEQGDTVEIIKDTVLGKLVVSKPSSRTTSGWLQVSLLAAIAQIPRPQGVVLDWLKHPVGSEDKVDAYVELLRGVYQKANLMASAPSLLVSILSAVFEALGNEALAFLAGIWIAPSSPLDSSMCNIQTIALHHGAAFLQAHVSASDDTDFQTIVPSLLVALQSSDAEQRRVSFSCLSQIHLLAKSKFKRVYGFDTIYASRTTQIQYLDQEDLGRYFSFLMQHKEHLLQDAGYLHRLHGLHLQSSKNEKKRDNEYKQRVICYLSSHVVALPFPAQLKLLGSLDTVTDGAKMLSLAPTIAQSFALTTFDTYMNSTEGRELLVLLASSYTPVVAKDLNEPTNWATFLLVVHQSLQRESPVFDAILRSLKSGLFAALSSENQVSLLEAILKDGLKDREHYSTCKQLLVALLGDVPMICHMLSTHQVGTVGDSPRSAKRSKTAVPSDDSSLASLNLLAEVLVAKSLPGSLELVSQLLETLNSALHSGSSQKDADYLVQLLMSAIEDAASKITVSSSVVKLSVKGLNITITKEAPNLAPNNVRLDVLVELLRVAENPQTFHQALLLIASLTRLAPDSVLRNVMPIFTFMGSNVFHRDDSYSFRVVQQTVDNIVPIMATSLKEAHSNDVALFKASRPFLRTFSDAAHHVPRHRRLGFFSHLLEVLGVEFLSPLCMLLIEKSANRIVRQIPEDAANSVQLPRSLLENQMPEVQIKSLADFLMEAQRLVDKICNPDVASALILEPTEEDPDALVTALFRRAKALLVFISNSTTAFASSMGPDRRNDLSQFMSNLISLTDLPSTPPSVQERLKELATSAQLCLYKVLGAMHASDFLIAVLSILQSDQSQIYVTGLTLLSERLPMISASTRKESSGTMTEIITSINVLLKRRLDHDQNLLRPALEALGAVARTLSPGEEASVTEAIPLVLNAIKRGECVAEALSSLSTLPSKIGPRIIPLYREIVEQCIAAVQTEATGIVEPACDTIHGLLVSIPTFWGIPEIVKVLSLIINSSGTAIRSVRTTLGRLSKTVVKHAPATVVLRSLLQIWDEPWLNQSRTAYMDFVQRAIRNTSRAVVLDHLKAIFKVFLGSFDLVAGEKCSLETQTITAFRELVVKLNEAAFRPLFRRLYDWAFAGESDFMRRKIVFCHIYTSFLEYFKGLMTPYMSFVLDPLITDLVELDHTVAGAEQYWLGILQTFTRSLVSDDDTFWRDDKVRRITAPIIQQVSLSPHIQTPRALETLQNCLGAIADTTNDDTLLKNLNLQVLMHTRSEEVKVRQAALLSSTFLWNNHGTKMIGLVADTVTFIAECSEDDNDIVVSESFRLKDAVENAAGSIDGLLDR